MSEWETIKERNITDGAVQYSPDTDTYRRIGSGGIVDEADYQTRLHFLGFPVPRVLEQGIYEGSHYYIEERVPGQSLHEVAIQDMEEQGRVSQKTVECAIDLSSFYLQRQLENSVEPTRESLVAWFEKASHFERSISDHPHLDSDETAQALETMFQRLAEVPMSYGHLDYGFPNAFPEGIIDWEYHSMAPVGFDPYLMLDVAAFMGGSRGYDFTDIQRAEYLAALDMVSLEHSGVKFSNYRGDYLLAKGFFFIATVRKGGYEQEVRSAYRAALCQNIIRQYNTSLSVDPGTFPSLAEFTSEYVTE